MVNTAKWTQKDTGSADEVKETILHSYPLLDKDDIIIGIVDYDNAGLSAYGYLKNDFEEKIHNTWKNIMTEKSIWFAFLFLARWIFT